MSLILEREGVALTANERNKRNENLTKIENAINAVGNAVPEAQAAKLLSEEAKAQAIAAEEKSDNVQLQINQLVVDGDSSVEAAQARVSVDGTSYSTLKERLDAEQSETAGKLADKAEKEEARLKAVKITQTDVSEELLAQIAGTAAINAVPANKSLVTAKYADKSIERQKTDFLVTGKNLYDFDARLTGHSLNTSGAPVVSAEYDVTPFIPVIEGLDYTFNKPRMVFFYDADKVLIGTKIDNSTQAKITLAAPAGSSYARAATYYSFSPTFQVERGTAETAFEPFKLEISKINVKRENLGFDSVGEGNIVDNAVTPRTAEFIDEGKNRFNLTKATVGSYLQETSGNLIENANFTSSDFTRVDGGVTYTFSALRKFVSYDLNKVYLNGMNQTQGVYTFTPVKDGFIRFSYDHTLATNVQMEIGSAVTAYEKYGFKMPNLLLDAGGAVVSDKLAGKKLNTFGDSIVKGAGNGNVGIFDLISQKYGMTGANYAVSGASIAYYSDRSHIVAQIQSAITAGITPDYIVMNGGINDVTFNVLGEIAADYNYTANGFATFSAGLEYCFGLLKTTFPKVPIVYVWVHRMPSRLQPDQLAHRKRALEIAEKWSVPVVDLYKDGGMNTMLQSHLEQFTFYPTETSGTHPNADGYNLFYLPRIVSEMRRVSP